MFIAYNKHQQHQDWVSVSSLTSTLPIKWDKGKQTIWASSIENGLFKAEIKGAKYNSVKSLAYHMLNYLPDFILLAQQIPN